VRTDKLDAVAGRLGLEARPGSRAGPDGQQLRWRSAGIAEAAAEPFLPFFVQWTGGTFPGRSAPPQAAAIASLMLQGDPDRLSSWLGEHSLPIEIAPGRPALAGVVLAGARGETVVGEHRS
jgi:hypothetical protein